MNGPATAYETSRLEALARVDIDSGAGERRFDAVTRLAAMTCNAPVAFVGFEVAGDPFLRSYAGAPLLDAKGYPIGVLAVMDFLPRGFTDRERQILRALANAAVTLLDLGDKLCRLEGELAEHVRYERRIEVAQGDLRKTASVLTMLSTTDGLTHLANRSAFDRHLAREINRVVRNPYPLSLLTIDIDDFKQFNDSFGHPAGDEALRTMARLPHQAVRKIDFAARIGGDEFAVVLPFTDLRNAKIIAERCRAAAEAYRWQHRPLRTSVGAAQLAPNAVDGCELVSAADQALYRAKFGGRNMIAAQNAATPMAPTRRRQAARN